MYRGNRPGGVARVLNAIAAWQFGAGVSRRCDATLLVRGRVSGRTVAVPVVVADYRDERYLVSMLGQDANWVRNVRQADGRAALKRRTVEDVSLIEVPPGERAPILKRYLTLAPGARPHVPVDRHAPVEQFAAIAGDYPVFRVASQRPTI